MKRVNELTGIKESDTGLAPPALWDLAADKQTLQNEQPLQVLFFHSFCLLLVIYIIMHLSFKLNIYLLIGCQVYKNYQCRFK